MARRPIADSLTPSSKIGVIPAPTGGWNARDPLSDMQPNDAVVLDNFIPGTGGVSLRPGTTAFASGLGASVQSLLQYYGPSAAPKLFGAASSHIYDVTGGGAVGAAVQSGLTNAYWSSIMFGTPGGNFLVACNGADATRNYDGASWTSPTITGVSSSTFIQVCAIANRLFFVEKNSMRAWYLGTQAISGAANSLDFGAAGTQQGGTLVAIANWTRDGGDGADDVAVFIFSQGDVLLYQGTDPSSATTWQKVGAFSTPPPIGRRCFIKAGADVAVLTTQGVLPLSTLLAIDNAAAGRVAFTDKIRGAFLNAWRGSGSVSGWEMVSYPGGQISIINIPDANLTTSVQYVMNDVTGAWCRFFDINAVCWALLADKLYYGKADGTVGLYSVGIATDNNNAIQGVVMPAFSAFETANQKQFLMAQPLYSGAKGSNPPLTVNVDYDTNLKSVISPAIPAGPTAWGSAWGSPWSVPIMTISLWQGVEGIGRVGTVVLQVSLQTPLTLQQTLVLYAPCENALAA